jgi:CarboxypepD_reg-like domain/Secretion system C-terminal sorting domain
MKKNYILMLLIFEATHAYSFANLQGKIYNKHTKEPLTFTPIGLFNVEKKLIVDRESDANGDYFFEDIKEGNYYIWAAYIGYVEIEIDISIKDKQDLKINIEMIASAIDLPTVVVTATSLSAIQFCSICCSLSYECFGQQITTDTLDMKADSIFTEQLSMTLFPNPASNKLFVKASRTIGEVSVRSLSGLLLMHQYTQTDFAEINIATLPNGLYIVQVEEDGRKVSKKFTKFE